MADYINYIIAVLALVYALFKINQKANEHSNLEIGGIGIAHLRTLSYIGIVVFVLLILFKFFSSI